MHIRSVAVVLASIALFACANTAETTGGESRDAQTKPGKSSKSSDSAKTPARDETKAAASSASGIDGTWDITALGSSTIGASEMTITGGTITGVIVSESEGFEFEDSCTLAKDRTAFKLVVTGDALTGTFTREQAFSKAECGEPLSEVSTITATRAHADKNATGATALEGDWVIASKGEGGALAVTVTGLAAKAWSAADKKAGAAPALTSLVQNGAASTTTDDSSLTFAARKR